jgi:hypothetical protein
MAYLPSVCGCGVASEAGPGISWKTAIALMKLG